ncbi:A-kinase anchor protein 200-like [Anopheles marshallii]|uniref:A-kinase anchor protein 200-like n=1 Tax=Anopheles marshallii TaxID=1521116 RepID=UPI00237A56C0|nr:A-kinase anchor protein 200-like [Anopheles marshallii]
MGLAQSKRSVNITTDPAKEGVVAEGTGKLEKIGEVDQLKAQANGDTQHNDGENETKVETDAAENEKDSTTEKTNKEGGDGGGGDTSVTAVSPTSEGESDANNKTLENGSNDESLNDSKAPAAADEASKKPKKPKKKWSFRNLSFSKKDKQKPAKKEKDEERVNGECEKVPEEPTEDAVAGTAAVAQEAASTTVEAGTSETKAETVVTAAPEVSTTTATATDATAAAPAADVTTTTTAPAVDTTKVEEPAIEAVAVVAQETAVAAVVPATAEPKVEPKEVAPVVVEEPSVPLAQEEKPEPETTTTAVPIEEKVVESAAVEVNTSTPPTSTTTTTSSSAVKVENKSESSVESEVAATSTPSNTTNLENSTTTTTPITLTENVVSESEKIVDGGDSTPPPPLPSIPPPSQVMVFVEASLSQVTSDVPSSDENPSTVVSVPTDEGQSNETQSPSVFVAPVEGSAEVVAQSVESHGKTVAGDVSPLETSSSTVEAKEVEPAIVASAAEQMQAALPSEMVPEAQPTAEVEESVVSAKVAEVSAAVAPESEQPLVTEEIKETVSKAVGEILEQAVDKIESGEVPFSTAAAEPAEQVIENEPSVPLATELAAAPLPEAEAADEISNNIDDLPPPPPPPAVDDEETVPDSLPSPLPTIAAAVPMELDAGELKQQDTSVLSVDISSPLPQNSLESLPSPPTLSQSDVSLPPPPESPTAVANPEQQVVNPESEAESAAVLPSPPPAPSSTGDDPISSSIPSSLPAAEVEVAKQHSVDSQGTAMAVAATAAVEASAEKRNENVEKSVPIVDTSSSEEKKEEMVASAESADAQQDILAATKAATAETETTADALDAPPVAVPAEVEETVAQKQQNGTVEHGTTNGTTENGKTENGTTENGTVENGQNGVHETSATESLNGEAEHKKEEKIPEKAAQLQQPPPAAPEVTAE